MPFEVLVPCEVRPMQARAQHLGMPWSASVLTHSKDVLDSPSFDVAHGSIIQRLVKLDESKTGNAVGLRTMPGSSSTCSSGRSLGIVGGIFLLLMIF